jgi:hypothetical protein
VLSLLEALPMAFPAEHDEVLAFIEGHHLMGKGLGYIDVHLLASAVLTGISPSTLGKNWPRLLKGSVAGMIRRPDNEPLHRNADESGSR